MNQIELKKETEMLNKTIDIINEVLLDEKEDLKKIFNDFIGDREELWKIADRKKIHISNLETSLDKPYFARIDFTSEIDGKTSTIYIGKNGVMQNTDIVVTDWRAPISSLYYDSEIGKCSYEAPDGIIKGNMDLKRQFEIEKGKLLDFYDVDLVSNDTLLQKYLNSNNDARLKSIVSTIQKEQNDVIRKRCADNIIIQGVAGSGKTTVALHRIAYLVYNYMDKIKQNQYLVIGPNPVFLKYIKSVLPELDVSGVEQCTFEQYAKDYINEDININPSEKKVIASISGKNSTDIDKFKCSMRYKQMIDKFLDLFFNNLTSKPLMLGDFEVLPSKKLREVFESTANGFSNNLSARIELTIDKLCNYIEYNFDSINSRYGDYSYEVFQQDLTNDERNKLRSKFAKDREELRKCCRSTLRKYFNKGKVDSTKLYKLFISTFDDFNICGYKNITQLKKEAIKNIKNNSYDFEDLSALIYIKSVIAPNKDYSRIRHVVIDEAQDLGEFNFYTLKKTLPSATFSIFGDLAQSIYDYRGINNWDEVNETMFDRKGEIVNFNKSYRTTAEIMDVADDVAESLGLGRSELVVRHGSPVKVTGIDNKEDIPSYILEKVNEYKNKGYKNIAIISKTDLLSNYLNDELAELGLKIPNVSANDDLTDDNFRVCTISNQLSKGLEFDAVIINNASEDIYSSNSSLDMKLLYVALTRALHELEVIYSGEITKSLSDYVKKNKQLCLSK